MNSAIVRKSLLTYHYQLTWESSCDKVSLYVRLYFVVLFEFINECL